ncbi:MAG: 30S ribosomal protein S6 [bacterium]
MDYETIFITPADISEGDSAEVVGGVKKILEDGKTSVEKEEVWGKKYLAYEIKKNTEGVYHYIKFSTADSKVPGNLVEFYRYNTSVLKFLTVKVDKKKK